MAFVSMEKGGAKGRRRGRDGKKKEKKLSRLPRVAWEEGSLTLGEREERKNLPL